MSDTVTSPNSELTLPPAVVSKVDLSRMVSDLENVDSQLTTAAIRAKEGVLSQVPPLPEHLEMFLVQNKLTLSDSKQRQELIKRLRLLKDQAPVVHMTFAVEADRASLQQLAAWLRSSVHPQAVISVGLQPALVAGVYVRTANHVHDLSVRGLLDASHDILVKDLEALSGAK